MGTKIKQEIYNMEDLLRQYKGDQSNFDCVKNEIQNLLDELEAVNRLMVNETFCNDVLSDVKKIRLTIQSII